MLEDIIEKQNGNQEDFIPTENLDSNNSTETIREVKSSSVEELLKEELKKSQLESEQLKDSFLRERAEFQNYKRRTAGDFLDIKRESVKKIISSLLEPMDSLEKVVSSNQNPTPEMKPFLDGVEMIRKQLSSILEKENVFRIDPQGEPFDPSSMEAVASEDLEELKEETVIEVYRSGYVFKENDKTIALRNAMVKVGRPKF